MMWLLSEMRLAVLLPELYLALAAMLVLMYGVYRQPRASQPFLWLAMIVLATTAALVCWKCGTSAATAMNGMFIADGFASFVKLLLLTAAAMTLLLSAGWADGRPFEIIPLMLFSLLGMMVMVSANDMLTLYMGLEMSSLALYVLAAFDRDHAKSAEAGLKYFVLGALASGMMLFGISLVYGFAGSTGFEALADTFAASSASKGVVIGVVFMIVGLCFKVSAVPFHMWAPDVYEGAPTPVTAFFATAPKIAALALFTRVMLQPFGELIASWQQVIVLVSIASMFGGAFGAIMQGNIKRLLAYSSIAHAGFVLMGLAAGNTAGVQALLIYLALYIFMSAGAFGCVLLMRRRGHAVENVSDLSGLSQTQPLMAATIGIFMFSMAGIPPLAGFFGKWYVVLAAVEAGLVPLAVAGVVASVVGCYYYLKVVKIMYFDAPAPRFDAQAPLGLRLGVAIGALVTLWFFLMPSPLVNAAMSAAQTVLK